MPTTITLTRVWLASTADLTDSVSTGSIGSFAEDASGGASARGDTRSTVNTVVQYAAGRYRSINRAGTSRAYTCTLRSIDWPTVLKIDGWLGQVCLLRDRSGRKIYGTFPSIQVYDYPSSQMHDVSFVLTEVTLTEAV